MKFLRSLFAAALFLPQAAFAQQQTDHGQVLATALGAPVHQWVFNHICVPAKELPGPEYTNRDFVDAYFIITKSRWNAALDAKTNGDEKASMTELAKILHGIIDSYWPSRVQRDASGAVVAFRDCESLGNLHGLLRAEKSDGPGSETQKKLVDLTAEVIRGWKDSRPFDEVAAILRSGPMKLSPEYADSPLLRTP
jgi:hypothetical protein